MAPKKSANLPDEVEEIKKSLDFLSAEIKTVAAQQNKIMELMGERQSLKIQNIEKDKKITFLENRVADLEQYTRMNDLIISGLKTRHRSYARAAAASEDTAAGRGGADAPEVDRESLEQQYVTIGGWINLDDGLLSGTAPVCIQPAEKADKRVIMITVVTADNGC
ncbi:Kinesin-related protein 11 [Dissostichus eleginoides]|uniref:Kinesin-related protein 11 n=1 Tax=Dissostichus eleginoides TaxID=100907 RepID=A0AAD9BI87_DISEL|nr:Kinesin-related protein 11 [Dissostichus eleginoides]